MTHSSDLGSAFAATTSGDFGFRQDLGGHGEPGVIISDPALLFSGRFRQVGDDLVIHRNFQSVTIHDYFRHAERPVLYAPDGSALSPGVVDAITEERHGLLIAGQQPPRGDAIGRVEQASGGATVIRDGMVVDLHVGDLVFKGDAVQTDDHGALAILFIDGTAFNLSASARMVLNEMVYQAGGASNSSLLSVVQGSISFVAGNIAHTGDMKVDTPVATMGIRGTAVHVVSPDHGPTRFSVMREPDGRVGRYVLYDRQDPTRVIGTLSDVNEILEVQLADGQVVVRTLPKTPEELSQERDLTGEVFHIFRIGQDHPLSDALHAPSQSGGSPEFLAPEGAGPSQNPAPFGGQNVPFQTPPVPSPPAPPIPLFPPLVLAPFVIAPVADAGTAVTYGTTSVVATGQSAMDTPILTSRGGGDRFAFTAGASGGMGRYGTASIDATTGVVTYTASSAPMAGTTATESFAVTDTNRAGMTTNATANFTVDGGTAVTYATAPVVSKGATATETPMLVSPQGGDHFAFAAGASGGTGRYGTATLAAGTGVVTYTASSAPAAGTTATESFAITDTDRAGATTSATASFTVDGGTAVSYATTPVVASGHTTSDTPTLMSPVGGDSFAFASGSTGRYGNATLAVGTGIVTYTASSAPAAGTTATESFAITDTDRAGATTSATASFTVDGGTAVTYATTPVVAKGATATDTPILVTPEGGDSFAFASGGAGQYGTATVAAGTGAVTYTASSAPAAGTTATESFAVTDTDAYGAKTSATARFTVDGGTAVTYATTPVVAKGGTAADTPTLVSPEGGDQFAFAAGASGGTGQYGTATIAGTGTVSYTASSAPAAGTTATDSFAVTDTDRVGAKTSAMANFTVDGGTAVTYATAAVVASGHTGSDTPTLVSPVGGDSFAFALGASGGTGQYGTATLAAGTGAVTYTASSAPAAGTTATERFVVTDTDNAGATTNATARFTVDGGSAVTYAPATVTSGQQVTDTPTVTSPEGGDRFSFVSGSSSTSTAQGQHGTASIDASTGVITYAATAGQRGSDTFTVTDIDAAGATTTTTATFDVIAPVDRWIGPAGGNWQTGGNWSLGAAPANEDASIPSGATPTILSAVTLDAVAVSNSGTIEIPTPQNPTGNPQSFTLIDGSSITGGSISIGASGGTLEIESGSTTGGVDATLSGVTIMNAGDIVIGILTDPTLVLQSGTKVIGGNLDIAVPLTATASMNILEIERGSGGGATLDGVSVSNGGVIAVDTGGQGANLTLVDGTTIYSGTLTIATSGTLDVAAVASGVAATLDGVALTNSGAIVVDGSVTLKLDDGTTIHGGALTIATSGTLEVAAGASGPGATLDGVSFTNSGTIAVDGGATLKLDDGTTIHGGTFAIATSGILEIAAGASGPAATLDGVSLTSSGAITVDSHATLTLDDGMTIQGGTLTIATNGTMEVAAGASGSGATLSNVQISNGGIIIIDASASAVLSNVSGTGSLTIGAGATLEFSGSDTETVTFQTDQGTLKLDHPSSFTGMIAGISGTGDVIDLSGFNAATTSARTGAGSYDAQTNITTLTVSYTTSTSSSTSSTTETFKLVGDYSTSTWTVTDDGHGGANIVDPPAQTSVSQQASKDVISSAGPTATNHSPVWTLVHDGGGDAPFRFSSAGHSVLPMDEKRAMVGSHDTSATITNSGSATFVPTNDSFVFKTSANRDAIRNVSLDDKNASQAHVELASAHFASFQHVLDATAAAGAGGLVHAFDPGSLVPDGFHKIDLHSDLFALGSHGTI